MEEYGLLADPPDQLVARFMALKSRADVAALLDYREKDLNFWATHVSEHLRYSVFSIRKRSGGERQIAAPRKKLRLIQRRLTQVLQALYRPRKAAHGFIDDRSIVTNARCHLDRRTIFNVDLEDFFGSIAVWRVRGLFLSKPFSLPPSVATLLAQICCHKKRVPQGAPTSPVISNMICLRLDRMLTELARVSRCTYTRYADDITFSTKSSRPPDAIAKIVSLPLPHIEVGDALAKIINDNGFRVNERKVRLQTKRSRQEVTGIIVNEWPNVERAYVRDLRGMLHAWAQYGLEGAEKTFHEKYLKPKHMGGAPPSFRRVVRGKIDFLGMVRGEEDALFVKMLRWYHRLDGGVPPKALQRFDAQDPILRLAASFHEIEAMEDRRAAGLRFQNLLQDLFHSAGLQPNAPFSTATGGEQIDGSFNSDGETYLVEAKWLKGKAGNADLYPFIVKVEGKSNFTRGLFMSVNGYSAECLDVVTRGKSLRIVLMDNKHLERIFTKREAFADLFKRAVRHLAERGEPYMDPET